MIDQVRLGSTGLHLSRLALVMMSFGDSSRRAWAVDEHGRGADRQPGDRERVTFFDTADI